jgi:hypothetical protein
MGYQHAQGKTMCQCQSVRKGCSRDTAWSCPATNSRHACREFRQAPPHRQVLGWIGMVGRTRSVRLEIASTIPSRPRESRPRHEPQASQSEFPRNNRLAATENWPTPNTRPIRHAVPRSTQTCPQLGGSRPSIPPIELPACGRDPPGRTGIPHPPRVPPPIDGSDWIPNKRQYPSNAARRRTRTPRPPAQHLQPPLVVERLRGSARSCHRQVHHGCWSRGSGPSRHLEVHTAVKCREKVRQRRGTLPPRLRSRSRRRASIRATPHNENAPNPLARP